MFENREVLIGNPESDHVRFDDIGRPDREDWFEASVEVHCDGWRGKFRPAFQKADLRDFAKQLQGLMRSLAGRAELRPIEEQIILDVVGDGKGHLTVTGKAVNNFERQTSLRFSFEIDQTYLKQIVKSLFDADPA